MNEIPEFEDALTSFREFLTHNGHPAEIVWIFRDDLWKRSLTEVFVRIPSQPKTLALTRKVFDEGRTKGLVDVHAIAIADNTVVATVWFPRSDADEISGMESRYETNHPNRCFVQKPSVHFAGGSCRFLQTFDITKRGNVRSAREHGPHSKSLYASRGSDSNRRVTRLRPMTRVGVSASLTAEVAYTSPVQVLALFLLDRLLLWLALLRERSMASKGMATS